MSAASESNSNTSFAYAAGDLIAGKYLLEEPLGEGGMGAVFRARNTSLDMLVAIKLLRGDLNRGLLAGRLVQEARAVAKLSHPAIVRVFDVGQTALGDPFIVMELLEGETLSKVIDRERRLSPIHAVQLMLPLADALSAAHAKGLVHRDFKPDNVLLAATDEGSLQPKLLDFGIVKTTQGDHGQATSDAGSVVGSPDYMSPEQARGSEQVDARSDLWSFSVVLYELIAGVAPFQAPDFATLLRMIVEDDPRTLRDIGAADHALSYIVSRGLNKDPMARYASASQMGRALAAWLADQGIGEDACGVSLETKWLARSSELPELGRKSWPPSPRTDQVSGIRKIELPVYGTPSLSGTTTVAPSSLAPTVESSAAPASRAPRSPRRWLLAAAMGSLLTLVWLLVSAFRPPQRTVAAQAVPLVPPASMSARQTERLAPAASADTNSATVAPSAIASAPLEATPGSGPRRRAPAPKAVPAASSGTKQRLSEKLLAPLTF